MKSDPITEADITDSDLFEALVSYINIPGEFLAAEEVVIDIIEGLLMLVCPLIL